MVSPEQSRAARAWLSWSQQELARRAQLSLSTVRDFEKGRRMPIKNNLAALERAIEAAGIRPTTDAGGAPNGIVIETPDSAIGLRRDAVRAFM
jgi:ribosome-binding protein aMBF1 (putative translation factor)